MTGRDGQDGHDGHVAPPTPPTSPSPPSASAATVSELMMPSMANNHGNVFGGVILSLIDRVAAVAAIRHARQSCVTVSMDRVDFHEPIIWGSSSSRGRV